jgi:hypothetical protein
MSRDGTEGTEGSEGTEWSDGSISSNNSIGSHDSSLLSHDSSAADFNREQLEHFIADPSILSFDSDCLRTKSNLSKSAPEYKFDTLSFDPNKLLNDIPLRSPKLHALLKQIDDLDKHDMKTHNKLFKHFIFSDIKSNSYGVKLLASALIAKGMTLGYMAPKKQVADASVPLKKPYGKIELLSDDELLTTRSNNFYLLSSAGVYDQSISVAVKKQILQKMNQRPENIHGDFVRIILLDSGYKEGIDLFDIKYIHIFEPQITTADQKQVIGRGTRTCGQKGLAFHPTKGWPLHVFIYDIGIPETVRSSMLGLSSAFDLYLKSMNIDIRLFQFSHDLERLTVLGSVDYELNKNIHRFTVSDELDDLSVDSIFGGADGPIKTKRKLEIRNYSSVSPVLKPLHTRKPNIVVHDELPILSLPSQRDQMIFPGEMAKLQNSMLEPPPLQKRFTHEEMTNLIQSKMKQFEWTDIEMENLCKEKNDNKGLDGSSVSASELIKYTPTQDFIRHYFTPANPVKGMLLWQSVGTGKTCSAIAAATSSFEPQGYTILWVTRATLKNDIWKNMFEQICSETIRYQISQGATIPPEQAKRMRMLSKSWKIRPISYKQFSNLVSKQNNYYKTLVKINGPVDPLRKTLLIIDEAHKLYGGEDLSSLERPDMNALRQSLMNSYAISGVDSVRLLLMTATPITQNPMELIKLINLCKPVEEQMQTVFSEFAQQYLNDEGKFTDAGETQYLDDIAGYVSYLNREKDARQFAQPIVSFVKPLMIDDVAYVSKFDKRYVRDYLDSDVVKLKTRIQESLKGLEGDLDDLDTSKFGFLQKKCDTFENPSENKACLKVVRQHIRDLLDEAKVEAKRIRDDIKTIREEIKNKNLFKRERMAEISERMTSSPEDYERFKESMYYNLKHKCGKKVKTNMSLKEASDHHPAMTLYNEEIQAFDERISELRENLKNDLLRHQSRMKMFKELMRTDLNELERSVVRMTIQSERKTHRKRTAIHKRETEKELVELSKSRRKTERKKAKVVTRIRNTMKATLAELKREELAERRAEKSLRKTLRKQGECKDEIKHELVKNLVDRYSSTIDSDLTDLRVELKESAAIREAEKADKIEKKQDKARDKVLEKEQKREQTKKDKATRKLQNARIRYDNKAQKLAEKQEKKEKTLAEKVARKTKKLQNNK